MKKPTQLTIKSAFSLVELLVVIAVIAIIAAIAIPNIAGITGAANTAKAQRNAQNLASTYNAAIAAGMPTNAASSVPTAVTLITSGTNVVIGNTTNFFRVDGLSTVESSNARALLLFQNGTLQYNPGT